MTRTSIKKSDLSQLYIEALELRDTGRKHWCLMWKTENMLAPAFWYYNTRQEARSAARRMHRCEKP